MSSDLVTIATRKSPLALWQAHYVRDALLNAHPNIRVEILGMSTQGDKILDTPLAKIGGKGLFIKELEVAMLEGHADIAVHSMKDVPMAFPSGLGLAVICPREDPSDAFVSNRFDRLDDLPRGARVGTCSLRRRSQLLHYRPDLVVTDLRGNVNTRLSRLDEGEYDAIILAAAGLMRLDMASRIRERLPQSLSLPAVGQGAVGIECRDNDERIQRLLSPLHDPDTAICVEAERAMNRRLEGGCQVPIAGFATLDHGVLSLEGRVGSIDGTQLLKSGISSTDNDPEALGLAVAEALLAQGAEQILASVYGDGQP